MRKILPILMIAFIYSCGNTSLEKRLREDNMKAIKQSRTSGEEEKTGEEKVIRPVSYSIERATKADFDKAKKNYSEALSFNTTDTRKKDGLLQVLINGRWESLTAFKDTLNIPGSDNDGIREYKYLGHFKQLNRYLVEGYFWEFFECYLIDNATGKIDTTWTRPYISPDKKSLASLSMPFGLEGLPLGVQVFSVESNGQKITKIIEINQEEWSPYSFCWESPNSMIIKVVPVEKLLEINGVPKQGDFSYIRLKI